MHLRTLYASKSNNLICQFLFTIVATICASRSFCLVFIGMLLMDGDQ